MSDTDDRVALWTEALARMEASLADRLGRTPPLHAPAHHPSDISLEPLDARLAQWHASLEQVERRAAAVVADLDADLDAVGEWVAAARLVRGKLAGPPSDGLS